MNTNQATSADITETVIKYGPHAGHIMRGNYKISTDKNGKMVAHKWTRMAGFSHRYIRCDIREALVAK